MKFLQSLDPRGPDYALLLAQKAAHRLCFAVKEKERKQRGARYFLKRSVLLGAAVLSAAFPHPLVWNGFAVPFGFYKSNTDTSKVSFPGIPVTNRI